MDILAVAEIFLLGWLGPLTTLGFVGVAKWIWNIIATSTEESVIETRVIEALEDKEEDKDKKR